MTDSISISNGNISNNREQERTELVRKGFDKFKSDDFLTCIKLLKESLLIKEDWNVYLGLGWSYFKLSDFAEAKKKFEASIKLNPEKFETSIKLNPEYNAYQGIGFSLVELELFEDAIDALNRSLNYNITIDTYRYLAKAYCGSKRYEEAIEIFNSSLCLEKSADLYSRIGYCWTQLGDSQKALEAYKNSIEIEPSWKAHKNIGTQLFRLKNHKLAIEEFKKSIELNNKDWDSYQGLAWSHLNLGDYKSASIAFKNSLNLKQDWSCHYGLGCSLYEEGELMKAEKELIKSINIVDHHKVDPFYLLGKVYMEQKNYVAALTSFMSGWNIEKRKNLSELMLNCMSLLSKDDFNFLNMLLQSTKKYYVASDANKSRFHMNSILDLISEKVENRTINPFILKLYSTIVNDKRETLTSTDFLQDQELSNNEIADLEKDFFRKTKSKNIISFGDCHSRIFNGFKSINNIIGGAATAYNINKGDSSSGAYESLVKITKQYKPNETTIIFTMGEIDLRMHVNKQSKRQNRHPEMIIDDIVKNYINCIDWLVSKGFNIIINAPHCGGGAWQTCIRIEERNNYCSYLNRMLFAICSSRGIKCVSFNDIVVNSISRQNNTSFFQDVYHLRYAPEQAGLFLLKVITKRILKEVSKEHAIHKENNKSSSGLGVKLPEIYKNEEDIRCLVNIIGTDIPGLTTLDSLETGSKYKSIGDKFDDKDYSLLLELPFAILPEMVSLYFSQDHICQEIVSICYAIYECCDDHILTPNNIIPGETSFITSHKEKMIITRSNFRHCKFQDLQSRFIFITLKNLKGANLNKIGISRMKYDE